MNADCTCGLEWLPNAEICKEFEPVDDEDCEDCCKHCRHSELCHPQAVGSMEALKIALTNQGYFDMVEHDGVLDGIFRFIFTVGIVCKLDNCGYSHRYCYHDLVSARGAMKDWQDKGFKGEPAGYIVRK